MTSSKQQHIYQDNLITKARYEMTEAEKNIIYMVLAQIKESDPANKLYRVSVKEMAQIMGSKELNFESYKQATSKLVTRLIECRNRLTNNYLQVTFAASAEYLTGQGVIEIEISSKIRPFYVELSQQFTKLQLKSALSLKSVYAKRIYELLSMYKNMKNPKFTQDLHELKTMLGVIDSKTGKDSYVSFGLFEKRVLDIAKKEINGQTDLIFNYLPKYGDKQGRGRKPVIAVEFDVFHQPSEEIVEVASLRERLTGQFRLRPDQADQVLTLHSEEIINKQLYDIQIKTAEGKIKNIGSYTAKVFDLGKEQR